LKETFVRSSGPGGQHVNKTSSCVVLVHTPTNIQVKVSDSRSQGENRLIARKRLKEKLAELLLGIASKKTKQIAKVRELKARKKQKQNKKARLAALLEEQEDEETMANDVKIEVAPVRPKKGARPLRPKEESK
jgi:protein subunit release factor B